MSSVSLAIEDDVRAAKLDLRLRVLAWIVFSLLTSLLFAVLIYTVQAAQSAAEASRAATRASQTNTELLERMVRSDEAARLLVLEVKRANEEEGKRFQALLDSIFGKGAVTLGEPATVPPLATVRGTQPTPTDTTPSSSRQAPPPSSTPAPRPSPAPSPSPRPDRPPSGPVDLPLPCVPRVSSAAPAQGL